MSTVTKAVIPAAGRGTRFLPVTKSLPKEMLPVVDKPSIQYVVEEAVAAGITDILIISARGKHAIEDHFDQNMDLEVFLENAGKVDQLEELRTLDDLAHIHYIRQTEQLGLGHAVGLAREHIGNEPFAVMLGDDIMVDDARLLRSMLDVYEREQASVLALLEVTPAEIVSLGSAAIDRVSDTLGRVTAIVEKPKAEDAPSNLAVIGRYVFSPEVFDAIDRITPGVGGELQLTDAIGLLLDTTAGVFGQIFTDGRYDIGKKMGFLQANIELALERDDVAPELTEYLRTLVKDRGLT
ncbi:MAG: UTP--glucose-1-phosphate uridylyltransferase GalU [Acidimicrobiia bacterium]